MPAAVDPSLLQGPLTASVSFQEWLLDHCTQLLCSMAVFQRLFSRTSQLWQVSSRGWREATWGICQVPWVSSTRLQEQLQTFGGFNVAAKCQHRAAGRQGKALLVFIGAPFSPGREDEAFIIHKANTCTKASSCSMIEGSVPVPLMAISSATACSAKQLTGAAHNVGSRKHLTYRSPVLADINTLTGRCNGAGPLY